MAFRSGTRVGNTGGGGTFVAKNEVLKENSGAYWIKPYLSDGKTTRVRMLPSIWEGQEELALNPDAAEGMPNEDILGQAFFICELTMNLGNKSLTYISGNGLDNTGTVVSTGWSAANLVSYKLRYKLEEALVKKRAGAPTDVPQSWFGWARRMDRMFRKPAEYILIQCLMLEEDGKIPEDPTTGQATVIVPAVLAIPRSAMGVFLTDIKTRSNHNEPLSLQNNLFGDICSLQSGKVMMMRKVRSSGNSPTSNKNDYNMKLLDQAMPLALDEAGRYYRPWEEILNIPTVEESIKLLIDTFDPVAIDFCLRDSDYAQYIPAEHKGSSASLEDTCNVKELRATLGVQGTAQALGAQAANQAEAPAHPPFPVEDDINYGNQPPAQTQQQGFRPQGTTPQATDIATTPPPPADTAPLPTPPAATTDTPPQAQTGVEDEDRYQNALTQMRGQQNNG